MDIKQLTYFVQVAIDENYTVAARKLFISQPALSKVMKNLEQELGLKLFYYSDKKTKLTDAGQELFAKAKKLIEEYNALLASIHEKNDFEKGHVTLGIPPILGSCYFSAVLAGFNKAYPGITITIVEKGANGIQQDVMMEHIDIGFVILPIFSNQFDSIPIIENNNLLLVHKSHPLAGKQSVRYSDLKDEIFVIFNEDFTLHNQIISACRNSGFEPMISVKSSQWDFIVELVSHNQGVSILPRPILEKFPNPDIRTLSIEADSSSRWDIALISKRGRYMSYAGTKFIEYVTNAFSTPERGSLK